MSQTKAQNFAYIKRQAPWQSRMQGQMQPLAMGAFQSGKLEIKQRNHSDDRLFFSTETHKFGESEFAVLKSAVLRATRFLQFLSHLGKRSTAYLHGGRVSHSIINS